MKENQPSLLKSLRDAAEANAPLERSQTKDPVRRNRAETRLVEVFDAGPAVADTPWQGLIPRFIRVTRTTFLRRARDGLWDQRQEVSFHAASAPISAKKAAQAIRSHWAIENRSHYVRDVTMLEDASRIRVNPGVFARIRSFALNIMRANGEKNIADALWRNALNPQNILNYRYSSNQR